MIVHRVFTGEAASKGLDTIVDECSRLKKIVTEMILLAKLESEEGIFQMEKVAVQDLLAQTLERINPLLVKKELQVQLSEEANETVRHAELYILADREKLLQALINIVSNAARYARKTIRFHAYEGEDGIRIEIADDGDGIPDDLLPLLFQRFAKGKDGETGSAWRFPALSSNDAAGILLPAICRRAGPRLSCIFRSIFLDRMSVIVHLKARRLAELILQRYALPVPSTYAYC
ncbi:sensor histidine kinase [Paenibacillus senegalensis]|nr:HAMP domain-containing sensor histidine kinase [Paenibacillus senegalensis]